MIVTEPLQHDPQLELIAIQLESIRERNAASGFLGQLTHRLKNDFLHKSAREKAYFLRKAYAWAAKRVHRWMAQSWLAAKAAAAGPRDGSLRVAAACAGGLGDMVIYAAFLDCLYREFRYPAIDVILEPTRMREAEFVFRNAPSVRRLVPQIPDFHRLRHEYDLVVRIGDLASYESLRADRCGRHDPALLERLNAARQRQRRFRNFIDVQPSFDGLFASVSTSRGLRRLDVLGYLAGIPFTQDHQLHLCPDAAAYERVHSLGLLDKNYITVHNGWDNVAHRTAQKVTKSWPEQHYVAFVEQFKKRFPDVLIVQLGAGTSTPLAHVDHCLVNRTSLSEAAWILKHALLHVDGDSGMVHVARAMHTRSVVLFGPTNHDFFRYAPNIGLVAPTCTNCWYSTPDWMLSCPRGLSEPECMRSIEPAQVVEAAERHLTSMSRWGYTVENSWSLPPHEHNDVRVQLSHVLQTLSARPAAKQRNLELAILGDVGLRNACPAGYSVTEFAFDDPASATACVARRGDNPAPDFGSLLNVPADDETFDVVVLPSAGDCGPWPLPTLKEGLRIVKDNGSLILPSLSCGRGQQDEAAQTKLASVAGALEQLGVHKAELSREVSGIAIHKQKTGTRVI